MPTVYEFRPISPVIFNEGYRYLTYPPAAAEDWEKGAPILLDAGEIEECGADPAAILGFATAATEQYDWKEDTFGHVAPSVPVALATHVFRGTLSHATGDEAIPVVFRGEFDPAYIGEEYGLTENADGIWFVDFEKDGAAARVVVLGVEDGAEEDDINVPCIFSVLPANRQVVS